MIKGEALSRVAWNRTCSRNPEIFEPRVNRLSTNDGQVCQMFPAFFNPDFLFWVRQVRIKTKDLHLALVLRVIVRWKLEAITDQSGSADLL